MSNRRFFALSALTLMVCVALTMTGCSSPTSSSAPAPAPAPAPLPSSSTTAPVAPPSSTAKSGSTSIAGHTVVTIKDFSFNPATLTAKVGVPVVWQNRGSATHSIVLDDGSAKSTDITPGAATGHTFTKVGTYGYHDGHYPKMKGTVIVK